ncbi:MAG: mechanosensitive ion channel family protein, partial [Flavobacteriales bacterium]
MIFQKELILPEIAHVLYDYFISIGFSVTAAKYFNMLGLLLAMLLIISIIDFLIRKILIQAFTTFAKKTTTTFDDFLVSNKVPRNIAHIVPLWIALEFMPTVLIDYKYADSIAEKGLHVFSIILTLWIVRSLLNTLKSYFKTLPHLRDKPIDSYIQVFMIFAWIVGIASALAIVTGFAFIKFITTLGAASAVIILIFKDTILG